MAGVGYCCYNGVVGLGSLSLTSSSAAKLMGYRSLRANKTLDEVSGGEGFGEGSSNLSRHESVLYGSQYW